MLLDKRDPLFLSLVLMVYSPQGLRQNEGTPFLSPSPDQRHGSPLPGLLGAILLALPRKGANTPQLTMVPAKQAGENELLINESC